jgi:hypothetical protein
MLQFQAELTEVFSGAQTSLTSRWTAAKARQPKLS